MSEKICLVRHIYVLQDINVTSMCLVMNVDKSNWTPKKTLFSYSDLKVRVTDLQVTVKAQNEEIEQLRAKAASIEKIWEALAYSCDTVNRAHLFDNEVKIEGHLSVQKIITIMVKLGTRWKQPWERCGSCCPDH